jgi:hypothetical protein
MGADPASARIKLPADAPGLRHPLTVTLLSVGCAGFCVDV